MQFYRVKSQMFNRVNLVALGFGLMLAGCENRDVAAQNARTASPRPPVAPTPPVRNTAGTIVPQASVNPCFLTAQNVTAALGSAHSAGVRGESYGGNMSCRYQSTNGGSTFQVNVRWTPAALSPADWQNWVKYLAPTVTPIAGDADKAAFQWQADMRTAGLHYNRKNLVIEYRLLTAPAGPDATRAQFLALPRLP